MKRVLVWLAPALLAPAAALAVGTQSFVIDTSEAFDKGKLDGSAVHGDGRVTRAINTTRVPLDGAPVAYASATGPDQAVYVSTGNQGQVYRVDESGQRLFARTEAPLVSALVWVADTLYAGTLEQGKVLAIDRKGQVKDFAALPGAAHVWALAHDAKSGVLYAATGPEGKLFAIDKGGKAKLVHDDEAEHLLCMGLDAEGRKYVGTSNGARLLRVQGDEVRVLYDAPGQELTALALGPGFVAVASNEFSEAGAGDPAKDVSTRARRGKAGKGKVFQVSYSGLIEELYRSEAAHVTALEVDAKEDAVLVGLGHEGRIMRVKRGQQQATWADADERQIVAIHLNERVPHFLSSDGVALYRVNKTAGDGLWTSAVLDAKTQARFGALVVRKQGDVTLRTRSGNTEIPDRSWSDWSAPSTAASAPIASAPARFLQVRANLKGEAELYALEAFYVPQNLPAYVRNVRATLERDKPAATPGPTPSTSPKTQVALNWDVDNPDADKLRYRLYYRRDGQKSSLPILPEQEILEKTEQRWETVSLPDGYYRVRVEASDELSTPAPAVTKHEAISAPILVDNHPPTVGQLRFAAGRLSGEAEDSLGPIALIELAVDGGIFRPLAPEDGLCDGATERFSVELTGLAPGLHVASVRVTDGARNASTSAIELELR